MKYLTLGFLLSFIGCLQPYNNNYGLVVDAGTDDGPDGGPDMSSVMGSGVFVQGRVFGLESEKTGAGPVVQVDGYAFPSMPADVGGNVSFELPAPINIVGLPYYVLISGTWNGQPVHSIIAPKLKFVPTGTDNLFHFFEPPISTGIPGTAVESLKQQSAISAADAAVFDTKYVFGYGNLTLQGAGLERYNDYTVVPDNPSCKVYYAQNFPAWKANNTTKFVDITLTKATFDPTGATPTYDYFVVYCPVAGTNPEITLTQTSAAVHDRNGNPPPNGFPMTVTIPLRQGFTTLVEWALRI